MPGYEPGRCWLESSQGFQFAFSFDRRRFPYGPPRIEFSQQILWVSVTAARADCEPAGVSSSLIPSTTGPWSSGRMRDFESVRRTLEARLGNDSIHPSID